MEIYEILKIKLGDLFAKFDEFCSGPEQPKPEPTGLQDKVYHLVLRDNH